MEHCECTKRTENKRHGNKLNRTKEYHKKHIYIILTQLQQPKEQHRNHSFEITDATLFTNGLTQNQTLVRWMKKNSLAFLGISRIRVPIQRIFLWDESIDDDDDDIVVVYVQNGK